MVGGVIALAYDEQMHPRGGLKLKLEGVRRDDRRVRFARVVARASDDEEIALVTDSSGGLRYRLSAGDYRLRLDDGVETEFRVEIGPWTAVRAQLPERCFGS